MSEPEAALVERARGDREAFGELYRLHAPAIFNYLRRRAGNVNVAEDLTAQAFLKALSKMHRFRAEGIPFRFWIYRIATNLANSNARRERWRRAIFGSNKNDFTTIAGAPPVPASAAAEADARRMLAGLAPDDQTLLILRYVEEFTIDEVANILRCPAGTVQSRAARARERLKRILQSKQTS